MSESECSDIKALSGFTKVSRYILPLSQGIHRRGCLKRSGKVACLHRFETLEQFFKSLMLELVNPKAGSS